MESSALRLVPTTLSAQSGKKDYVNKNISNEPRYGILFTDFVHGTTSRSKRMGKGSKNSYGNLVSHIKNFAALNDVIIYTNSINEEFLDDFILYLQDLNLSQNYIKGLIGMAKSMARIAGTYGYAIDPTFDNVDVEQEDSYATYLTMNEITRIYYYKGLTRFQERIKDLFVIGCLTALRYSDYSTLAKVNFQGDFIVKNTKKTGIKVIVPMHDYVKEIIAKYDYNIEFGLSNQHFNRYIKKICKQIGFSEPLSFSFTQGGTLVNVTRQKWELISSHTARRSAATNMYQTQRLKTFEIMSLTGHTTEKSFFRYIKVTRDDLSKQIAGDSFFRK